jgi:hypothetical protein
MKPRPTTKNKKLPVYQLVINKDEEIEGINAISLVADPAIEVPFLAFSNDVKFEIESEDQQILFGPVLIPGQLIYRSNFELGEDANVFFSAEDVEFIVQTFFKNNNERNVNLEHSLAVEGATLYQSFISDKENGINPKQFENLPDHTFYVKYKVYNETLWQSCKNGEFTGFSLEGFFDTIHISNSREYTNEEIMERIIKLLEKVKE